VCVVLAWEDAHDARRDDTQTWESPSQNGTAWHPHSASPSPGFWTHRQVGSTALAPSNALRTAAFLDDEFDPRRLVKNPVTVLDLGRNGIHLIVGVRPERDRDHWIGIEENASFVWSKVVLRSLSEPSLGTFLARFSFAGSCPYELIRRAIVGRPAASKRDKEPGRA